MLTELQQKQVWEGWLSSETRANYFADMGARHLAEQNRLTWATLIFSAGVTVTILSGVPSNWEWLKPTFGVIAAATSFLSLVRQNQKRYADSAELHYKWNLLAQQYEDLWADMYRSNATDILASLRQKSAELSKSAVALHYNEKVMLKWEDHVVRHHTGAPLAA